MSLVMRPIEINAWGPGTERDIYVAVLRLLVTWPSVLLKSVDLSYTNMFKAHFKLVIEGPAADVDVFERDFLAQVKAITKA